MKNSSFPVTIIKSASDLLAIERFLWGMPSEFAEKMELLAKKLADRSIILDAFEEFCQDGLLGSEESPREVAYKALLFTSQLILLVEDISPEDEPTTTRWNAAIQALLQVAEEATGLDAERYPLAWQILAGEIPWMLGYFFPETKRLTTAADDATEVLARGMVDLLDAGIPHAIFLPDLPLLLAIWTRILHLHEELGGDDFPAEALSQYAHLVTQALRFAPAKVAKSDIPLYLLAVEIGGDEDDRELVEPCIEGGDDLDPEPEEPGFESEWAGVAMLRTDWRKNASRLVIRHPEEETFLKLVHRRQTFLDGVWTLDITCNEHSCHPKSDWEQVCWVSDDDIDYLELEQEFSHNIKVERTFALSREDDILMVADIVRGPEGNVPVVYKSLLTLPQDVHFEQTKQAWDGELQVNKKSILAMPLCLPEWQEEGRMGSFAHTTAGLELVVWSDFGCLFAPIWFDLNPKRYGKRYTWRHLTVAESLEQVGPGVAKGFRVQSHKEQWLIYRSLAKKTNRSLLGHNLSSEGLLARFDEFGEVTNLVEID